MTVIELIRRLHRFPRTMEVKIDCDEGNRPSPKQVRVENRYGPGERVVVITVCEGEEEP